MNCRVKNGTILTLQFKIDENAKAGDEYAVKISYNKGDIFDRNINSIDVSLKSGVVGVLDYLPGDLDGDRTINSKDIILLRRHVTGGYNQTINEAAGDVNNDGNKNSADIILIRRHVAGGYNVVLKPSSPKCDHSLTPIAYKAPDCESEGNIAYWTCFKCGRYYSDADGVAVITKSDTIISATGHTTVIDPAVEPTYDSTGLTEGKHCSACGEVIIAQTIIPALQKNEYSITYEIANNDDYLKSIIVENPNPATYSKEEGLILQNLHVDGYSFVGWFTAQTGGTQVTEIAVGTTGAKTFYAHWEKAQYTVQFKCDMAPQSDLAFNAGEEKVLPQPELDKYTFVGWSDENGKIWTSIPKGTARNLVLYANWSSNRNKAVAKSKLDDPIIMEDSEKGLILFAYEIGEIQNVPLFTTLNLQCANGIITTVSKTMTEEISSTQAKTIAQTVSNATTNSSTWTLENNWNNTTEVSQYYIDQTGQTREEAESLAQSESGTYNLSTSNGSSEGTTKVKGGTYRLSGNKAHSNTDTTEKGQSFDLSVDAKLSNETSIGAEGSIDLVKLNAQTKFGFELGVGADYGNYIKNTNSGTDSWSNSVDFSSECSNTTTSEKTWNTSEGYSNSRETSKNVSVANAVSKIISQEYGYGSSYAEGGSNSSSQELASTDTKSNEFSSTVTYHSSKIVSTTESFQSTGDTFGSYRMVMAGTIHVFAVVGYDVAENTYFVYTYNVLDDKTEEYLDYSRDHTFNDYETSIIPFNVPYFVNEYVNTRIAKTSGLVIDTETGKIEGYAPTSENPDTIVVIPSYISVDNGDDTFTTVKVRGIADGLFKNNTNIKGVKLGNYITEIPDSAFEGCTSLEYVISPGVTKIGNNAFSGCTSLNEFNISSDITYVGTNAFKNVPKIKAVASSADVAQAISSSGSENVVLDISAVPVSSSGNMSLDVGNITSFELQGKDEEYSGLSLKSDAETTVINGVKFTDCNDIPMEISSENVTLNKVSANVSGIALVLSADNTKVKLNQTTTLTSSIGNAVLCKTVAFSPFSNSVVGKMKLSGNMYVAGEVSGTNYITFDSGEIIKISADEFENSHSSISITFDANGGSVSTTSKTVKFNDVIGDLPAPTYGEYTFLGWYTKKSGGSKVTSNTVVISQGDMTLYARWNNWDGTSSEPVYDPITKTYTITTGNELAWVSDVANGIITNGTNFPTDISFGGYTIELLNNIYLNDISTYSDWEEEKPNNVWNSIGTFSGVLDGKNFEIKGMYLRAPGDGFYDCTPLFDIVSEGAYVKNLSITNSYYGGHNLGVIANYNYGSINNCTTHSDFKYSGGIVDKNYGTISSCSNYGDVERTNAAGIGGIAAENYGIIASCKNYGDMVVGGYTGGIVYKNYGTVTECGNYGDVTASANIIGGIIAINDKTAVVEYSYNKGAIYSSEEWSPGMSTGTGGIVGFGSGAINCCYNDGFIENEECEAGGICGSGGKLEIYSCFNSGKVESGTSAGGIYGGTNSNNCSNVIISYCHNESIVESNDGIAGGIAGTLQKNCSVEYCYNNMFIIAESENEGSIVGKIYSSGSSSSGTVKLAYCYYNSTYGKKAYSLDEDSTVSEKNVKSISDADMKKLSNFTGFSTSIWGVDSSTNGGYPYLKALKDSYQ